MPTCKRALEISCWRRSKHCTSLDSCAFSSLAGSFNLSVLFLHLKCLFSRCRHRKERRRSAVVAVTARTVGRWARWLPLVPLSSLHDTSIISFFIYLSASYLHTKTFISHCWMPLVAAHHCMTLGWQGGCHLYPAQVCMALQLYLSLYLSTSYPAWHFTLKLLYHIVAECHL